MQLKGLKINFLGDSITEGYTLENVNSVYHAILKEQVGLNVARNYGICGTRIATQKVIKNEREDPFDFCSRYKEMEDDADIVVVFGGTNDYGHGDAPLGNFTDRTPNTFYGACHYLFAGLREKYKGKPIVIITPLHREGEDNKRGEFSIKPTEVGTLLDYVNVIKEVATHYSLPVLDLYEQSGLKPEKDPQQNLLPDGLHPNEEGHKIIARKLKEFLENL